MIEYDQIQQVHLEISSLCNASCPYCPRNFWGYPHNSGYPETNLTLDAAKKIFTKEFLQQLKVIRINGNLGDIVMNPEAAEIVEYFCSSNNKLSVEITTNGGARNKEFWARLGRTRAMVAFGLDGLEDTHHLYRQNTVWNTVINNAKSFINAGGHALWQFIKFDHNAHQIDACRELSQQLGFKQFDLIDNSPRTIAPVFNKNGDLTHVLGNYKGETDFKVLFFKKTTDLVLLEDILPGKIPKTQVTCAAKRDKEIYIAANGEVYPCCYTGFYPRTFGQGNYHQAANAQLIPLISKNNALEYGLAECIQWFNEIKNAWDIQNYKNGRLIICDDNCGK